MVSKACNIFRFFVLLYLIIWSALLCVRGWDSVEWHSEWLPSLRSAPLRWRRRRPRGCTSPRCTCTRSAPALGSGRPLWWASAREVGAFRHGKREWDKWSVWYPSRGGSRYRKSYQWIIGCGQDLVLTMADWLWEKAVVANYGGLWPLHPKLFYTKPLPLWIKYWIVVGGHYRP